MPGWKKDGLSGRAADYILCPFFRAHNEKEILCEGHVPGSKTIIRFNTVAEKKKQQTIFCEGCYERCEHFQAVKHFTWPDDEK